jgi:hypothetical protein
MRQGGHFDAYGSFQPSRSTDDPNCLDERTYLSMGCLCSSTPLVVSCLGWLKICGHLSAMDTLETIIGHTTLEDTPHREPAPPTVAKGLSCETVCCHTAFLIFCRSSFGLLSVFSVKKTKQNISSGRPMRWGGGWTDGVVTDYCIDFSVFTKTISTVIVLHARMTSSAITY